MWSEGLFVTALAAPVVTSDSSCSMCHPGGSQGLLQHRFHQEVAEIIQLERQEARIQGAAAVPGSLCAQEMALPAHTFSGDGWLSFSACHELGSGQFSFPKSTELPVPPCALSGNAAWPGSSCDIPLPA